MTTQRRVVRNNLKLSEERQTIAAGDVVLARATRDYADDIMASRLELWIETEVLMPAKDPGPGQPTVPWPAGTCEVVVLGTDKQLEPDAVWLASVDDHPMAWHVYRVAAEQWAADVDRRALVAIAAAAQARRCGASPEDIAVLDPRERPFWRATCSEEPGHDATNPNTPHRAKGLGRHGQGELAWTDEPQPPRSR